MLDVQTQELKLPDSGPQVVVVVPVHNEGRNVNDFVDRLLASAQRCNGSVTAIFVDDGSTDNSLSLVEERLDALPGSQIIELSRNFGKEAALLAGMDAALGTDFDALILIDADLQHPPEVIPDMVAKWLEGSDVVIAARRSRASDPFIRRHLSKLFYKMINQLADVAMVDGDGDFRLLARRVVEALCVLREQDRFTKGLYAWVGFRQARIYVDFDQRRAGKSRFSFSNLAALAGSAITSFSAKPLRLALYVGAIVGGLSLVLALWIGLQTLIWGKELPGYASIFCGFMFIGGIQLISIGLLGEYVGRAYMQSKARPPYVVRQVIKDNVQ